MPSAFLFSTTTLLNTGEKFLLHCNYKTTMMDFEKPSKEDYELPSENEGDWDLPPEEAKRMVTKELQNTFDEMKQRVDQQKEAEKEERQLREKMANIFDRGRELRKQVSNLGNKATEAEDPMNQQELMGEVVKLREKQEKVQHSLDEIKAKAQEKKRKREELQKKVDKLGDRLEAIGSILDADPQSN